MSNLSRRKGANYELEICKALEEHFGAVFKRNLDQCRDGGNDINVKRENGTVIRLEAKRRRSIGNLYEWMEQATNSCSVGDTPVVVCRGDNKRSLVVMDFTDFLMMVEKDVE